MNLYHDNVDLPQIKPRTINNRNEFYVAIPQLNPSSSSMDHLGMPGGGGLGAEISKEEAKRAQGYSVIRDYEQRNLVHLRQTLKTKQEEFKRKQRELGELKR